MAAIKSKDSSKRSQIAKDSPRHGLRAHPLYSSWHAMKRRAESGPSYRYWRYYAGKGVKICDEWRKSFVAFYEWAIANGWRDGLTIDRIDNDGNYEPGNCRFITQQEQACNRSNNRWISAFGQSKTIAQWSRDERCSVSAEALNWRLSNGWEAERAILTPTI